MKIIFVMLILTSMVGLGLLWLFRADNSFRLQFLKTVLFALFSGIIALSILWVLVLLF
jgi:hypothetical protein